MKFKFFGVKELQKCDAEAFLIVYLDNCKNLIGYEVTELGEDKRVKK